MKVRISDIRVGSRLREDPGDLGVLKDSLRRLGLLQPIVVDTSYKLVAGYRRLVAARSLGWESIEARVVSVKDRRERVTMEAEENTVRKNLTADELEKADRILERYNKGGLFWGVVNWILR